MTKNCGRALAAPPPTPPHLRCAPPRRPLCMRNRRMNMTLLQEKSRVIEIEKRLEKVQKDADCKVTVDKESV